MTPETAEKTEYRSKDIEFMANLQMVTYEGMRDCSDELKMVTWERIRKQVTMNDLIAYAVRLFNRNVLFPLTDYHKGIAAVFEFPAMPEDLEALEKMMAPFGIKMDQVYATHLRKVASDDEDTEKNQQVILNSELSIVNPSLILSFGVPIGEHTHEQAKGAVINHKNAALVITNALPTAMEDTTEEQLLAVKGAIWQDVQNLMSYYKL